jgi:hypothetical protein
MVRIFEFILRRGRSLEDDNPLEVPIIQSAPRELFDEVPAWIARLGLNFPFLEIYAIQDRSRLFGVERVFRLRVQCHPVDLAEGLVVRRPRNTAATVQHQHGPADVVRHREVHPTRRSLTIARAVRRGVQQPRPRVAPGDSCQTAQVPFEGHDNPTKTTQTQAE